MKDSRLLLPIKTKDGLVYKRVEESRGKKRKKSETEKTDHVEKPKKKVANDILQSILEPAESGPIPMVELLARREEKLQFFRYQIGKLSSEILENPNEKLTNFITLLDFLDDKYTDIFLTIQKLAAASLLEIFKDLLPSYNMWAAKDNSVKLKKETLQLQNFEGAVLKYYKQYLQKLEKMASVLKKKISVSNLKVQKISSGRFAISCMSSLLISKPYFNFSSNIANFLVVFLDNKNEDIRKMVAESFSQVFQEDKRGEISLIIIRGINQYIKIHKNLVHVEVISVLLSLQIRHISSDPIEDEKRKKIDLKKQRMELSKKEKKRRKKMKHLEKELLEVKAEENKSKKHKVFSEIANILFMIYFRILKKAPRNKVLSSCLEGLSKFSQCISIDYYQDLLNVFQELLNEENLKIEDQLYCIHALFSVLSHETNNLKTDATRFYFQLYKNLLNVHLGKNSNAVSILIDILHKVFVNQRKSITQNCQLAFIKRISGMTLNLQHNGALGMLYIIKLILQANSKNDVLLDTDNSFGDGFFKPELNDPGFNNAHCTSLWELIALQRHYHPVVQKVAKNIASKASAEGDACLPISISKLSPEEVFNEFNPLPGKFNPNLTSKLSSIKIGKKNFSEQLLKKFVCSENIENLFMNNYFNIFEDLSKNKIILP